MKKSLFLLVAIVLFLAACAPVSSGENEGAGDNTDNQPEGYEDIKVVAGKVRFYLSEKADATRTAASMTPRDWAKSKVEVNGKSYTINMTDEPIPRPYVEVEEAESYKATLMTSNSAKWYGKTRKEIMLPHSQIHHTAISSIKSFPMFAEYAKATGNKLIFNDGFAMIMVKLRGSAKISSVKIEGADNESLAGLSAISTEGNGFMVKRGMPFVALNCTNKGDYVQLSDSKTTNFRLMVAPGEYPDGLRISICDSQHGAMFVTTEPLSLTAGDIHSVSKNYECEKDLVFYEGFDNFVWGGDVMKGSDGYGFSPTSEKMTLSSGTDLTGYEDAFAEVAYDNPGTGFVQPNSWNDVKTKCVGEVHQLSESYVKSRNIGDWLYMYRIQEHPGYIASGTDLTTSRGVCTPSAMANMTGIGDLSVKIRFALQGNFYGGIELSVLYGGVIKGAKLNGKVIELGANDLMYNTATAKTSLKVDDSYFIPSSLSAANKWQELEFIVNGATDGTRLHFQNTMTAGGNLGIYIDKIEVRKTCDWRDNSNLRVMLFNVQNGVCTDQHNNYDNFVEWVKKYDPDICIWCESETIYEDKSNTRLANDSDKYLPDNWDKVAVRYGHNYVAVGGNRDNYPQTITSKFPINTIQKISKTDDGGLYGKAYIVHGAGHFQVNVHGKRLNIVSCHMHPMEYAPSSPSADQAASAARYEGDYFREYEMKYIVKKTINHSSYAGEEYWLLGGDTNSRSPYDEWYYGTSTFGPHKYLVHKHIIEETNLKDVIADRLPKDGTHFVTTTYGATRIDFLYASSKLFDAITNSVTLMDSWTNEITRWEYYNQFWNPSDHRPIVVDFEL